MFLFKISGSTSYFLMGFLKFKGNFKSFPYSILSLFAGLYNIPSSPNNMFNYNSHTFFFFAFVKDLSDLFLHCK